jgi:chromosome segregation ATPase
MGLFRSKEEKIEALEQEVGALIDKQAELKKLVKIRSRELAGLKGKVKPTNRLPEGFKKDITDAESEIQSIARQIIKKEDKIARLRN